MKTLWFATVLLLVTSSAAAQEQPACDVQIQTANAMMKELMQQVHVMSNRAAQHYAGAQALGVELAAANAEIDRLQGTTEE